MIHSRTRCILVTISFFFWRFSGSSALLHQFKSWLSGTQSEFWIQMRTCWIFHDQHVLKCTRMHSTSIVTMASMSYQKKIFTCIILKIFFTEVQKLEINKYHSEYCNIINLTTTFWLGKKVHYTMIKKWKKKCKK